jgi:hypothetical protein
VKSIEFIFKRQIKSWEKILLQKSFIDNIPVQDGDTSDGFTVLVPFTAEETSKLPEGVVFMDTRIVLINGSIPETNVVPLIMDETLFKEVYVNG